MLTLTPFYPDANDDAAGCFIAEPLSRLDRWNVKSSVITVRPAYRRGHPLPDRSAPSAALMNYIAPPGMIGLPVAGSCLFARLRAAVRKLHAQQPLSLIHAHAALPCGHAAALLARDIDVPFVVTVHGRDVFSSQHGGISGRWCERVSKTVYQSAARVICISGRVEEDLLTGVRCRSVIVHNGVDADLFSPSTKSNGEKPVVLSVGNLIPSKGHAVLLKAVSALSVRHPHLSCRIIGEGPERGRLIRLAHELGITDRVQFLGRQSRAAVAEAIRGCDVFALPSSYEGLGCVYLEAMAAAKPAIGCTGQGINDVIQAGKNGRLIEPHDVRGLTETLDALLSQPDLRRRIGQAARQSIVEAFTLEHQAERLAQIYQECGR